MLQLVPFTRPRCLRVHLPVNSTQHLHNRFPHSWPDKDSFRSRPDFVPTSLCESGPRLGITAELLAHLLSFCGQRGLTQIPTRFLFCSYLAVRGFPTTRFWEIWLTWMQEGDGIWFALASSRCLRWCEVKHQKLPFDLVTPEVAKWVCF